MKKIVDESSELFGTVLLLLKDQGDKLTETILEEKENLKNELTPKIEEATQIAGEAIVGHKGEKGDPGKDGEDYVLTEADKLEIAKKIEVPVVEKVIEKTEVIKEIPIYNTTEVVKEKAVTDTGEVIVEKINELPIEPEYQIEKEHIKGIEDYEEVSRLAKLPRGGGGVSRAVVEELIAEATPDWGDIEGTLSDQTDLQTALDGKADALGADDNYVTDAEKANLHAPGSDDQDLSGLVPYTGATTTLNLGANNLVVDTSVLYVDATTDEVGMGTVAPDARLHISGNIEALKLEAATDTRLRIKSSTTGTGIIIFDDTASDRGQIRYVHNGDLMSFYTSGTEGFRIDSTGIGINPTGGLIRALQAAGNIVLRSGTAGGVILQDATISGSSGTRFSQKVGGSAAFTGSAAWNAFEVSASVTTVGSGLSTGINVSLVGANAPSVIPLYVKAAASQTVDVARFVDSSLNNLFFIDPSGDVGINRSSVTAKLGITGSDGAAGSSDDAPYVLDVLGGAGGGSDGASPGGLGGRINLVAGPGGSGSGGNWAGKGGLFYASGGVGAEAEVGTGGEGGNASVKGGNGADENEGGDGGNLTLLGGDGGAELTGSGTSGDGGDVIIAPGAPGADNGGTVGAMGSVFIGTQADHKIGFYDATPIVQPDNTVDIRVALNTLGLIAAGGVNSLDTNGGDIIANDGNFSNNVDAGNIFRVGGVDGYTGDLNDSTSTKIADVVGGIITAVYF